ncbi:MAG TPA: AMP-binding protein, partial [Polyangiaceae bacterium]|nr:AMP-binding protein [Polyangiaceae bacterium]
MSPIDLLAPLSDARRVCSALGGPGWLSAREAERDLARVLAFVERERARADGQPSAPQAVASHPRAALLVVTGDRYYMLLACLAAWCSGCTVILPPNHQTGTLERVRALSGATSLLTDTTIAECLAAAASSANDGGEPPLQIPPIQAEQHVLTAFTSGTTGDHLACPKAAGQLFGEALTLGQALGFDASRIVAATVPSHHLYGLLFGVLVPFFHGAAFVREATFQPAEIRNLCERRQVTDLVTVPAHLRALVEAGWYPPFRLERAFSSGAVLDSELAGEFHRVSGAKVIDVLGSTESGGIAWRVTEPGAVYVPLPGVEVAAGPDARLLLRSPFLPPGSGWQLMNDRVRMREAGFEHLGRTDGVVKLGAKRIAVQELEARARQLDAVTDAAVLVQPSTPLRGAELWLAVATEDDRWTASSLRQALGRYFDPVVLPRRYRVVPGLPRDALGKLQRGRLERLFSLEAHEFAAAPEVNV